METIVIVVHMLAALSIIGLILLQQGKGAEMGASFGAGASQTLFGSRGSGNFFSRTTAIIAALFFATSFTLAVIAKERAIVADELELSIQPEAAVQEAEGDVPVVAEEAAQESDVPNAETTESDAPATEGAEEPAEETPEAN